MVRDHENAVKLFQKQEKHGEAKELKDFAAKTLPTLEEHLKMARALAVTLGRHLMQRHPGLLTMEAPVSKRHEKQDIAAVLRRDT